jgi:hypothetical protein
MKTRHKKPARQDKARRSLERMLESMQPYLPRPDAVPPPAPQKWTLSRGTCCRRKSKKVP